MEKDGARGHTTLPLGNLSSASNPSLGDRRVPACPFPHGLCDYAEWQEVLKPCAAWNGRSENQSLVCVKTTTCLHIVLRLDAHHQCTVHGLLSQREGRGRAGPAQPSWESQLSKCIQLSESSFMATLFNLTLSLGLA